MVATTTTSRSPTTKAGGNGGSEERVVEPKEVDILCGRGGLSNHHPGNEWYRRLIRSNRPLYRACPKHTKLLVSKAIVQAVQQQGGRFLERSRRDGFWYAVPYKRAVDKTSQGLRERERDEDDDAAPSIAVPHQFSGQQMQKLSDLADVAIARATSMDGLPRSASGLVGNSSAAAVATGGNNNISHRQPAQQQQPTAPMMARAAPPVSVARIDMVRPPVQQQQQQQQRMGTKDALQPLPPSLEPRQSSMFRLLRDTKLLPMESAYSTMMTSPTNNNNSPATNLAQQQQQQQQIQQNGRMSAGILGATNSASVYANGFDNRGGDGTNHAARAAALYGLANGMGASPLGGAPYAAAVQQQQQQQQQARAPSDKNPPALTRLTTQVSDWLNSFWPVPATATGPPAAPEQVPAGATPPIVMISPPEPQGPIQIHTIPPMTNSSLKKEDAEPNPVASRDNNRADTSPPPLGDAKPTLTFQDSSSLRAPPTELEHSVSATLLKLASTPSKFFSGISMLFGEDNEDTANKATGPQPAAADDGPILAGTKRSKASLLDDDSDDDDKNNNKLSAMAPAAKKHRSSLLDDHEDSLTEAQFRTVYK